MNNALTEVLLIVGTQVVTDIIAKSSKLFGELLAVLVKDKYVYQNPQGQYKLTVAGQKAFKVAKREWVIEVGHLETGKTYDVTIDEFMQSQMRH